MSRILIVICLAVGYVALIGMSFIDIYQGNTRDHRITHLCNFGLIQLALIVSLLPGRKPRTSNPGGDERTESKGE